MQTLLSVANVEPCCSKPLRHVLETHDMDQRSEQQQPGCSGGLLSCKPSEGDGRAEGERDSGPGGVRGRRSPGRAYRSLLPPLVFHTGGDD